MATNVELEMWSDGSVSESFSGYAFAWALANGNGFQGQWTAQRHVSDVTLTELNGIKAAVETFESSVLLGFARGASSADFPRVVLYTDCQDALDEINLEQGDGFAFHGGQIRVWAVEHPVVVRGIVAAMKRLDKDHGVSFRIRWQGRRSTPGGVAVDNWAGQARTIAMRMAGTIHVTATGPFTA